MEAADTGGRPPVKKKADTRKTAEELKKVALGSTASDNRRKRAEEMMVQRESRRAAQLKRDIKESCLSSDTDGETSLEATFKKTYPATDREVNQSDLKEPEGDTPFELFLTKGTRKRLKQQQERMDELRRRAFHRSKGLFKVTFSVVDSQKCEHQPFPEGSLLAATDDLHRNLQDCISSSSNGYLHAWVNTVEAVNQLKQIDELASMKVAAECKTGTQFWGKIRGVDPGFTEGEILASLSNVGVTLAKREVRKILKGSDLQIVHTDRVRLQFAGLPPQKVTLARREYPVILVAEKPPVCYNCRRIGHISSHCSRPKACMKCGATNHLAAQCRCTPKCVNCLQNHPSWSTACPAKLIAVEQRKVLMEARVHAQARYTHKDATITERVRDDNSRMNSSNSQLVADVSYADAVAGRTIIVQPPNEPSTEINLPRTVLPAIRKAHKSHRLQHRTSKKPSLKGRRTWRFNKPRATKAKVGMAKHDVPASDAAEVQTKDKHYKKASMDFHDLDETFAALRSLVPIVKFFNPNLADILLKLADGLPVLMQALSSLGHNAVSKIFLTSK